jgi:hypothetical protein
VTTKTTSNEAKKGGRPHTPNRQGLYAKAAKHADAAIETLVTLLHSKNENIQLGAAKVLLDKCLPDMKAVSLKEENKDKEPLLIHVVTSQEDTLFASAKNVVNAGNGFLPPSLNAS